MQGKRTLANLKACKTELNNEIQLLFEVFNETIIKSNAVLSGIGVNNRSRSLEASIVQSFFSECLMNTFSEKAFWGKYRRLVLRINGYLFLFKNLDKKGYPMNIKTNNVQSILNQNQVLDLFSDSDYNDEPILYFGYQKNRFGEFVNPQIIYIDEGIIKFSIMESDIFVDNSQIIPTNSISGNEVIPKLKNTSISKKAN